jgi:EpsI family protein
MNPTNPSNPMNPTNPKNPTNPNNPMYPRNTIRRAIIASALMFFTILAVGYINHADDMQVLKPLSSFPVEIGQWRGKTERFDKKIYDILGVDDSFLCDYRALDGRQVQLYVGFYQSQREGDLIHSPKNCMPGSGWNITKTSIDEVSIPKTNPGKIKVIKLLLEKGNERMITLYWFQSRGRFIHSEYMQKIYLVLDAIFKHRTDGSFVRLISPIQRDETHTVGYMKEFAQQLIPILEQYLPGA